MDRGTFTDGAKCENTCVESLSPDVFVKDIMKEFDLITHEELISQSEAAQIKSR